ncbi:MAG: SHD1 domain-containing protein, partial [Gemmataceae bacterium]
MKQIFYAWVAFGLLWNSQALFAHPGHETDAPLKTWHLISPDKKVRASFLLLQSDRVKLSVQDGSTLETSLGNLSNEDQEWVKERKAEIDRLQNQTG